MKEKPARAKPRKFDRRAGGRANKKKIAVLYVATGRYVVFWPGFYESAVEYFLPGDEKTYFVFTDSKVFEYADRPDVRVVPQEKLGWPYDTLMRFGMFLKAERELGKFDYIFFFNANMQFVAPVGREVLPGPENDGLVAALHVIHFGAPADALPYERNHDSLACVPYGAGGGGYLQGALNGGSAKAYLAMCRELSRRTNADLRRSVMALWHDESHLNRYLLDKNPLLLPPSYGYNEGLVRPDLEEFARGVKVLSRDKTRPEFGGPVWLRGETDIRRRGRNPVMGCLMHLASAFVPVRRWRHILCDIYK